MSFLNKFKKEFEGLNLGDRLGQQQAGAPPPPPPVSTQNYQPNYQPYGNTPHQHQYQGSQSYEGRPPYSGPQQSYPGQNQHDSGYQTHNAEQSQQFSGHQPYSPQPPSYNYPSQASHPPQHQPWSPPLAPTPGPPGSYPVDPPPVVVSPYAAPGQSGPPCPTPPRWIAHWSAKDRQWYYVETTGRTTWQAPSDLPPLESMPAYPGSVHAANRGHEGQNLTHPPQPQYANPQDSRPSLQNEGKKSSSQTMFAAAGGFTAGGVAGYFIKDRIDKRKAKKRHGRNAADFADFAEYPAWEVNIICNICDQTVSGPYAHCSKCDDGDFDICRDCLAQGLTCDGKGKHNLAKVYPKRYCDVCDHLIKGEFFHCGVCNDGDWDTCRGCFDKGFTCNGEKKGQRHELTSLYIPDVKFTKGGSRADSSSDSD
ncbi:hypothetical protein BKA59DRAFT_475747 [Fusarium tricinctum]|uniref:WW domain-containing protein n=1 Tax=Fusarium tricinctum TaxID=61284 RepID=A0A8K0S0H0_9HYPO|nr:hypothetical protein BKA59DRAFT_475747 [Fusarium tricinctum]